MVTPSLANKTLKNTTVVKNWGWFVFAIASVVLAISTFLPIDVWEGGPSKYSFNTYTQDAFSRNAYDILGYPEALPVWYMLLLLPAALLAILGFKNAFTDKEGPETASFVFSALGISHYVGCMIILSLTHINDHLGIESGIGIILARVMLIIMIGSLFGASAHNTNSRKPTTP